MIDDRFYLICCVYDQHFNRHKVSVVKALRCLFNMSLRDAKYVADNYICIETDCGVTHRDITFRCTAPQTAWAMCQLQTGTEALYGTSRNEDGYDWQRKIFDFKWIEIESDRQILPICQYDRR